MKERDLPAAPRADSDAPGDRERAVYAKVTWRLVPFLFLCYVCAYLDRVNVGFAKLQMCADRGISDTAYGIGAGIFFIGYFFFEVPSNLILQRVGARRWIARIMVTWGVLSACMTFVTSLGWFYLLRFLLGAAEAGFFPGIILYLTYWYPQTHRARIVALFMTAIAVSGMVGSPVSGAILAGMSGVLGLAGWQWLFVLEAIPSLVVGLIVLAWLDDGPATARWLDDAERTLLLARLAREEERKAAGERHHTLRHALASGKVWALAFVYFGGIMGLYGVSFWLPQIVEDLGVASPFRVGLVTAVPWTASAIGMVAIGRHSDATGERRWHIAGSAMAGALGFVASALFVRSLPLSLAALTVGTIAVMAVISTFWSLPTAILSGTAAAAGIALINATGNLAGYVSPMVVGFVKDRTGSVALALYVLAGSLLASGLIVLALTRPRPRPTGDAGAAGERDAAEAPVAIRELTDADIAEVEGFAPAEWNFPLGTFLRLHLGWSYFHAIVATSGERRVGVGNAIVNGTTAWLGNIIVPLEERGRGVGSRVTARLIEGCQEEGCRTLVLIATALGEPIYRRLGFETTGLYRFYRSGRALSAADPPGVRPMRAADQARVLRLDRQVSGETRAPLLSRFFDTAWVHEGEDGAADGCYLPDLGAGLVIASDDEAGLSLLRLRMQRGPAVVVIPDANAAARDLLLSNGYAETMSAPRMCWGGDVAWQPRLVFSRGAGYCG